MPPGPGAGPYNRWPRTDDNTLINWICVTDPADQRMYVELATDLKRERKALDSRVNHMCKLGHAAYNEQVAEFVRLNPLWKQRNQAAGASSGAQAGDAPRVARSVRVECAPPPPARPRSFPNEEQADALAKARDATANVHIAGAAGTGKTAVIRAIAAEARRADSSTSSRRRASRRRMWAVRSSVARRGRSPQPARRALRPRSHSPRLTHARPPRCVCDARRPDAVLVCRDRQGHSQRSRPRAARARRPARARAVARGGSDHH